jgi:phospholipid/cholesterol/gamma-HCH transport system substrate-binding protein
MKKHAMETTVGIFVLCGVLLIGFMSVNLGHVSFLAEKTYPLNARFSSVSGLRVGSPVYIFGIDVGRVERLSIDQEDRRATVEVRIRQGIEIYDDAIASIRTEGLIGDKYLRLDPGGAGALLKPGGTITETQPDVDLAELIGKYAFGDVKK